MDVVRWKLYAFGVGTLAAGLAGAFFASFQRFVSPESFSLNESLLVLSIVVLGGAGRALPVVCSALFLVIMPEILRGFERYRPLVLGLVLVAVVIFQERLAARRRLLQENTDEQNDVDGCHLPACSNAIPPSPSDPLLTVRNLSKAFGAVQALAGVNFDVYAGEIVGVVGMNGAGKTTLLSCIAGSTLADHGEVELFANGSWETLGNSVPAFRRAQRGVVRTFQQPRLFGSLTASENVEVGARCHSTPRFWEPLFRTSLGRRFEEGSSKAPWSAFNVLASAKLTAEMTFIDQKSTELARALATNPLLLLVDEPASGNSPAGRRRLARILDGARVMGVSLIVVEHDLEFLRSICNRIFVMREGAILAAGTSITRRFGRRFVKYMVSNKSKDLLECSGLWCSYGGAHALRGLNMSLCSDAVVGLCGPNKSGKSTLARCIAGAKHVAKGKILWMEREITGSSPSQRLRLGISLCPEGRGIYPG